MRTGRAILVMLFLGVSLGGCASEEHFGEPEVASAEASLNGAGVFERVANFGDNPGGLNMFRYVPPDAPDDAPLMVAMHACSQNATAYRKAGWEPLADEFGFYVLYPEQTSANNGAGCFNWAGEFGNGANLPRGDGENQSIKNMIDHMKANYSIDEARVFGTGHSGGGAQSALMLATWPDVFAGGAILAGIPYRCTDVFAEVSSCLSPGRPRAAEVWGQYVRDAFPGFEGPWPKVSIWHGTNDFTVNPVNATELLKQWTNAHGIPMEPSGSEMVDGHLRETFEDADGEVVIERYTIANGDHATFVDPDNGCGSAGAFFSDRNICSSLRIAEFFGMTGDAPPPPGDREAPTVNITTPAGGATVSGMVAVEADAADNVGVTEVEFFVNGASIGTDAQAPYAASWDVSALPAGQYRLRAVARDAADNEGVDDDTTVTVDSDVVDEAPPTVVLSQPADGSQVNGLVSLIASAQDDTGVASVQFLVDGEALGTLMAPPYQTQWDTMGVALGAHTIMARATDVAGNTAEDSATVTVVDGPVVAAPPIVKVVSPVDGADVTGIVEFTIDATSADSPLTQAVLFWDTEDRGEVALGIDRAPPFDFIWDVRQVPRGDHHLIVRVFNQANGVGQDDLTVTVVDAVELPDGGVGGAGGAGGEPGGNPGTTPGEPVRTGNRYFGCQSAPRSPGWGGPMWGGLGLLILGLRRRRHDEAAR